jgi:hypothetical protein
MSDLSGIPPFFLFGICLVFEICRSFRNPFLAFSLKQARCHDTTKAVLIFHSPFGRKGNSVDRHDGDNPITVFCTHLL